LQLLGYANGAISVARWYYRINLQVNRHHCLQMYHRLGLETRK
jgi:hypothetical protein